MKRYFVYVIGLLSFVSGYAQEFQGVAQYESKTSFDFDMGDRKIPDDMKKRMEERMKSMFEKTFILTFNKTEATYLELEKLETPGQNGGRPRMPGFGGSGKYYKNIKDNRYTNQVEVFGKMFLVKDTLNHLQWKLENESKKIGNYTCFKATAVKPVDQFDFKNMRPRGRRGGDNKEGEENPEKEKDTTKTSLLDQIEVPKEITITAWYTPEIPVSMGPDEYNGLPGLILEINANRTTILCSKITLNPSGTEDIKEPSKGKEVSQEEFNDIMKKKMEEMRERFRSGGGRRGGSPGRMF
ncbi:GLPGLI family protein [Neptunitalea chrysea]|uniref:GLPGLI family protein n=1 Tax=Neptunitalea chrysea TaxID=1647581 RepID=A0A9W6B2L3_9FLAO|nr:GLPGLI family protein [Neptunitalea chrysea]GLB51099.1 GLPGLI family protein [Neptunitalea chrysea]